MLTGIFPQHIGQWKILFHCFQVVVNLNVISSWRSVFYLTDCFWDIFLELSYCNFTIMCVSVDGFLFCLYLKFPIDMNLSFTNFEKIVQSIISTIDSLPFCPLWTLNKMILDFIIPSLISIKTLYVVYLLTSFCCMPDNLLKFIL